jgi:hypothetical protein
MKCCNHCGEVKPLADFPTLRLCINPSGTCADCRRAENAERNRAYRERNKDAINARLAQRRADRKTATQEAA